MADPATYRPAPGTVPDQPGVYRFRDVDGRVIYVGKAKSLRSRLGSYFQDLHQLHPRTQTMVTTAVGVDWTVVGTEVEALALEYQWIKEFDPRFNVRYRDDKSYPYLAVTVGEEYPRLQVMRGAKRAGVRYFGPYTHAWAIRETLDLLLRVFPARTCSAGVFKRAGQIGRPCLLGYIGKCSAPCTGAVTAEEHRAIVDEFCDFMAGHTDQLVRRLESEMAQAAREQEYERAARLRDDLSAVRRAVEKQAVVLGDGTDADVVAIAQDALEAAVQVFYVRGGRVRGQRGWVVDKVEDLSTGELVEQFLGQVYGGSQPAPASSTLQAGPLHRPGPDAPRRRRTPADGPDVPREVLVPALPADAPALEQWLAQLRGGRVSIRVPQRGDKRALLGTVERNATEAFAQHKLRRASDLTARSQALQEIQEALGLTQAPLRIECFDVSHVQGTDVVASMVVFEDGLARRGEYRRFTLKGLDGARIGTDDTAWMHEVLTRRFRRIAEQDAAVGPAAGDRASGPIDPQTGRPRRFAYPPQLVVVDGGLPQVQAAARALRDLDIETSPQAGERGVALCGLAKRLEEVWLPDESDPVILPRSSEGLYLLQRIRDEAHRFAITYHRQRRSRSMTRSALDGVPGLGQQRRGALLRRFGSLVRLRAASADEIAEVPGIGLRTAQAVVTALHSGHDRRSEDEVVTNLDASGVPIVGAFDPRTGEVLE
ncbi:MAG TPA: excinuclease ABC subunit UvrC [Mycobacteriales bacterium]|nr:excinuclease ABC subunit UvrC [Mycobacteriales bacterium]